MGDRKGLFQRLTFDQKIPIVMPKRRKTGEGEIGESQQAKNIDRRVGERKGERGEREGRERGRGEICRE